MAGPAFISLLFALGSVFDFPLTIFWQCGFYFFAGTCFLLAVAASISGKIFLSAGTSGLILIAIILSSTSFTPERLMPLLLISIFSIVCALPEIRWGRRIGDATYGTYLWHIPIQLMALWIADGWFGSRTLFNSPMLLCAYVLIVAIAGQLSHKWIEVPMGIAVRRWLHSSPR